jgi:LCP family protein required for cell wall assembly
MYPQGDDTPPERPEDEGRSEKPPYTVYGRGGDARKEKQPKESKKPKDPKAAEEKPDSPPEKSKPKGKPEYNVYRSRPSLRDRIRKPDLSTLSRGGGGGGWRERLRSITGGGRPWLRWILIAIGAWILISFLSFAISAQIQKGELQDSAKDELSPAPPLLGANILILGGDRRGEAQKNANGAEGHGPPRADSIMVIHAGLGAFRKLSIPRDAYAAIPGCGQQKINASLACNTQSPDGNPGLTIKTVENFLGIDINHIVIVDFDGFADFIDTLGGVTVDVPDNKNVSSACELKKRTLVVAGDIDGGKGQGGVSIGLTAGEHTLQGDKALAFARLRHNVCDPSEGDIDRAARQQLVLNGIKGRLTSVTRIPYNFVKGPWIGWNAPKAIISDMGGLNLPQLAMTSFFGGGDTSVLEPELTPGPDGSILIAPSECSKKVRKLLGGDPPNSPECSPG